MTQGVMPPLHLVLTKADCSRAVLGADSCGWASYTGGVKTRAEPQGWSD